MRWNLRESRSGTYRSQFKNEIFRYRGAWAIGGLPIQFWPQQFYFYSNLDPQRVRNPNNETEVDPAATVLFRIECFMEKAAGHVAHP